MNDLISRQAALDALGDEPEIWIDNDEYTLGLNNQWHYDRNAILRCPSSQPEQIVRDIATIIENEKDMRVILKNTEPEERALHESCTDCPLYDHERHSCPRFNKVIPETLRELQSAQPKKKLLFSERQNIVREYQDWCLFNNAADCAESFFAYLIIKGFIDG